MKNHPPHMLAIAVLVIPLAAQETVPERSWKWLGEFGVGAASDRVVASAVEHMKGFIAAGVADGKDPNWCCRVFMTEQSLAATPLRFKLVHDGSRDDALRSIYMQWDYERAIDFAAMFAPMRPQAIEGDNAFHVKDMKLRSVPRPGGGYRMNFGGETVFGDDPAQSPLFTTYTDIRVKAGHERLLARLRQLPIFASFDLRTVMSSGENKVLAALFGPKAALLSGSVTRMGNRPVVDLYSAMGPGDGIVGQYLAARPGNAAVVGALPFEPGVLFAADLGNTAQRGLLAWTNAAPERMADAIAAVRPLLESWDGTLTLAATGRALPAELPEKIDVETLLEGLGSSLHGTVVFGVEDGSGPEIVAGIHRFLQSPNTRKAHRIEIVGAGDAATFHVAKLKHVAFGARDGLFAVSIAGSQRECLAQRTACLAQRSQVATPKKLGMIQGPVKLWVHQDLLRYAGAMFRGLRRTLAGASVAHRADWIRKSLEEELLAAHLAVSCSWTRRYGVMLRSMF